MDYYRGNAYDGVSQSFYDYMKQKCLPGQKIHVAGLKGYHSEWWQTTPQDNGRRWRPLHETLKRMKALKRSGKGGFFRLSSEWPESSAACGCGLRYPTTPITQLGKLVNGERDRPTRSTEASVATILHLFRRNR